MISFASHLLSSRGRIIVERRSFVEANDRRGSSRGKPLGLPRARSDFSAANIYPRIPLIPTFSRDNVATPPKIPERGNDALCDRRRTGGDEDGRATGKGVYTARAIYGACEKLEEAKRQKDEDKRQGIEGR